MPTLTLDLPETAYKDALAFTPKERNRLAAIMFATARSVNDGGEEEDGDNPPPTEDDLAAIGRGLADIEAGRTTPADVVFARYRERFGKK